MIATCIHDFVHGALSFGLNSYALLPLCKRVNLIMIVDTKNAYLSFIV
jgi:hypothetical protein